MRTTVDEDLSLDLFSRARYLILVMDGEAIHREANRALNSVDRGPMVTMLRRIDVEVYVMVVYSSFLAVKDGFMEVVFRE